MSISVSQISKNYGRQKALDKVSFEISSGQIVGFLGPNGAGKSTMMKILTGYLPPSEGEVKVCAYPVRENALALRRKVGYLPEHNPLYLDMYIAEYLHFVAKVYQIDQAAKRVAEVMEMTGLGPEQHKKAAALSKGYRQRVGLAQALLPDPEVLILDEPTSGLDPNQISGVRKLIGELGQSKTVLLSTHIMQEVTALCERVIIIDRGRIVADERADALEKSSGEQQMLIEVMFDRQPDTERLQALPGIAQLRHENGKWLLSTEGKQDLRPEVFRFAVNNDLVILEMRQHQPSLENIFRRLTAH